VEIRLKDLQKNLYEVNSSFKVKEVNLAEKFGKVVIDYCAVIYTKLSKEYFKNSAVKYEGYTNDQLVEILQSAELITENFTSHLFIDYSLNKLKFLEKEYFLDEMSPRCIDSTFYEYLGKPTKVIKANNDGVIVQCGRPLFIKAGDFLLSSQQSDSLDHLSASESDDFAGFLCDAAGNIIDSATPHYPGNPFIPLLGINTDACG
jgi:hypothetical protein